MLRVFLPAPPRSDRADRWIRVNAEGRVIDRGEDIPSRWPADTTVEGVLAADQLRLIALSLPPMPRERLRGAVRYALEDQIATPLDESAIAIAEPRNGTWVVGVASAALVRAIGSHERRFTRLVPESALAAKHDDGWTWFASGAGDGFVRRRDGSAFAVQDVDDRGSPPPEIVTAVAQARRSDAAPDIVHVAFGVDAACLARWSQACGVAFAATAPWQWEQASAGAFADAPDFLADAARADARARRPSASRAFRPALLLAALALAIQLGASLVQWSWLDIQHWRLSHALVDTAKAAQLADAASAPAAMQAIGRQYAAARHHARQWAPADALPLLARAAPALSSLPPGTLRSARYAGDTWTVEIAKLDPMTLSRLERRLADAGVEALAASTSGGTRMRLALAATAR